MTPSEKDIGKKWNLNVIEFALEREGIFLEIFFPTALFVIYFYNKTEIPLFPITQLQSGHLAHDHRFLYAWSKGHFRHGHPGMPSNREFRVVMSLCRC